LYLLHLLFELSYLKNKGVIFYTNEKVVGLKLDSNKLSKVTTEKREILTDEVTIASGSWSPELTKQLGLQLLVQAGKGYHIDVKRKLEITMPAILMEAKVAVTPMHGFTRFAGTMEIAGINNKINPLRVKAIANAAAHFYKGLHIEQSEINNAAYGLRPVSPDGLPYIGRLSKIENVTIATGHAMMGWSLGPVTGKLISEIITEKVRCMNIDLLIPERKF